MTSPLLVVRCQNWTDPFASAVMFKGGDNGHRHHSHLDGGTCVFDSLGVRWATDVGRADGYPLWQKAGIPEATSYYQTYPNRACGHYTLVINPSRNDYTLKKVPTTWMAELNPDQAIGDDKISLAFGPLEDIQTDGPQCTGSVNLSDLYARHGLLPRQGGASDDSDRPPKRICRS